MALKDVRLSSAYSIGKYRRQADFVNDTRFAHVPGPNKYNSISPDKTSRVNKTPSWSQSKASRFPKESFRTPGPGSYSIPSKGTEGPKFSTRLKPNINAELLAHGITAYPYKMRIVPGPGKYDPPAGAFKKVSYSI
jgi:hypothetical protein